MFLALYPFRGWPIPARVRFSGRGVMFGFAMGFTCKVKPRRGGAGLLEKCFLKLVESLVGFLDRCVVALNCVVNGDGVASRVFQVGSVYDPQGFYCPHHYVAFCH